MNNVYMIRDYSLDGVKRESGRIYDVDAADATKLVSEGYAVKADFPTLNNYRTQINRAVEAPDTCRPYRKEYRSKRPRTPVPRVRGAREVGRGSGRT